MTAWCTQAATPAAWAQDEPDDPVGDTAINPSSDNDDSRAWFHGTTEAQRARAREIFLEGNTLIAIPAYARAAEKYREAIQVWDNPAFHYNLAIAEINLLQPTEAYDSLKKAVRHGPEPLGEDKHQQALDYMKTLEEQLARVRITSEQEGVVVSLDGKPLFVGPGEYVGFVQPGGHQLVARKDGYNTESQELVASPGDDIKRDLRLFKPDQVLTARRWATWKPWAVVAGGALLMGGAAYFDISSSREFDAFDEEFSTLCPMGCSDAQVPDLKPTLDSATFQQRLSLTGYALGGAALVTGAVLVYVNRERIVRIKGNEESSSVSVIPTVSDTDIGVRLHMNF